MPKRVAILQSNYIPWKGYFDLIHDVDEFIFYDDVQYTSHDWRNRNRVKTENGVRWITIPVGTAHHRRICDVELPAGPWANQHWTCLTEAYRKASCFDTYRESLEAIYLGRSWRWLSDLNQHLIRTICDWFHLTTHFRDSRDFQLSGRAQDRLLNLLKQTGADIYISGPAAAAYIEPHRFADAGIDLRWKDYRGYPEYTQFHPPFVHEVSVLDLLFHTGPNAAHYIWGWREN
jgi:hypothetical protein